MVSENQNRMSTSRSSDKRQSIYGKYVKRFVDIILAGGFLLLFCWLYAILAIVMLIKMGRPIIFVSERIGRDGVPFKIYKYRSMTNEVDENGVLLPAPRRLTKFGRLLRSTSMDELPSIWNILIGDLSTVGPRPLPVKYQEYIYEDEKRRQSVRPGLTGWAQINGRNAISWDEKFAYDVEYVRNLSFAFDLKILFLTVVKVIRRSDIIQDDQLTASLNVVRADKKTKAPDVM